MGLIGAHWEIAVLGRLHGDQAGDQHLAFRHRIPLLHRGLSRHGFHLGDQPVRFRHDVVISILPGQLRGLHRVPDHHLQPGPIQVDGHPGQPLQPPQGLLGDGLAVQTGAVRPRPHPVPPQLRQDLGGGHLLAAHHLHRQDEPGQNAHRQQGKGQPDEEGVPPPEAGQKIRQPPGPLHLHLAAHPLGQAAQLGQAAAVGGQTHGVAVHPLQRPAGHPLLGAQVQQALRKQPPGRQSRRPPQIIDRALHSAAPMPAERR